MATRKATKDPGAGDEGLARDMLATDGDETPDDALIFDSQGRLLHLLPFVSLKRAKAGKLPE